MLTPVDVDVSVVIASRNGQRMIQEVIDHVLVALHAFEGSSELVLVDSASTDATSSIMQAVTAGSHQIRLVSVLERGASLARNAGAMAASGYFILFTDDDVLVPGNWITEMVKSMRGSAHAVAGAVRLVEPLRGSLTRFQQELLADTESARVSAPPRTIFGANMGFRREIFTGGLFFDTRVGAGTKIGYSEDTMMHLRLTRGGYQTDFVASAVAEHHVDPRRVTDEMWHRRLVGQAVSENWIARYWFGARPNLNLVVDGVKASVRLALQRRGGPLPADDATLGRIRRATALQWWTRELLHKQQPAVEDRWTDRSGGG